MGVWALRVKETDVRKYFKLSPVYLCFRQCLLLWKMECIVLKNLWYIEARADSNKSFLSEKILRLFSNRLRERETAVMTEPIFGVEGEAVTMFTEGPDRWQDWLFVTVALYKHLTGAVRDQGQSLVYEGLILTVLWVPGDQEGWQYRTVWTPPAAGRRTPGQEKCNPE